MVLLLVLLLSLRARRLLTRRRRRTHLRHRPSTSGRRVPTPVTILSSRRTVLPSSSGRTILPRVVARRSATSARGVRVPRARRLETRRRSLRRRGALERCDGSAGLRCGRAGRLTSDLSGVANDGSGRGSGSRCLTGGGLSGLCSGGSALGVTLGALTLTVAVPGTVVTRVVVGRLREEVARSRLPTLAVVEEHPVVRAVFDLARVLQHLGEELSEEVVVGRLLETELPDVVEVDGELVCSEEVMRMEKEGR